MGRPLGETTTIILAMLEKKDGYGLDLTQQSGLLPGTVYTTLRRLEERGLVEGQWEDAAVAEAERRPRRRYYRLTPDGATALAEAQARLGDRMANVQRLVFRAAGDPVA